MDTVIDRIVDIWKLRRDGGRPDSAALSFDLSAEQVLSSLVSTFPLSHIESSLEQFLFSVVGAYDSGELSCKQGANVGIGLYSKAFFCTALIEGTNSLDVSRHLLQEMIRTFPALEWHQALRVIINTRLTRADVLYALADGLNSRRIGQIQSASIGLVYYRDHPRLPGGTPQAIAHAITRIKLRLDRLLHSSALPPTLSLPLKAGMQHVDKWR